MKSAGHLRRGRTVLVMALIAVVCVLLVSELSYRRSSQALDLVGRLAQARLDLQTLQRSLIDAENSARVYLLAERPEDLMRYRSASQSASATMAKLHSSSQQGVEDTPSVELLQHLVDDKLASLRDLLALHAEGKEAQWRAMLLSTESELVAGAFLAGFRDRLAFESARIENERHYIYRTLLWNRVGVAAIALLGLVALVSYLRQTAAFDAEHAAQQRRLVEERDRLESQVTERTALLTELTSHLQSTREDERSKLARELHDELGALLTAAKLDVARLKSRLPDMTVEASNRIAHLNETLNSGIALKRRIIEELRPSSLGNLGLVAALDIQAHEFADKSGLQVRTTFEAAKLTPSVELTVYRLVQEALDNIAKFASARSVDISMLWDDDHVVVTVRDDGRGFDPTVQRPESHGLMSMRYRVEAEHGTMQVDSTIGEGTTVSAKLPLLV